MDRKPQHILINVAEYSFGLGYFPIAVGSAKTYLISHVHIDILLRNAVNDVGTSKILGGRCLRDVCVDFEYEIKIHLLIRFPV